MPSRGRITCFDAAKSCRGIGFLLKTSNTKLLPVEYVFSLSISCSGNGLLLKGGKEASRSNAILHKIITEAIGSDLGPELIHLITSRDEISDLLKLDDVIDLVIPRGGNALVSHIQQNTKIPVLGHADGICHVYVDKAADLDKAVKIVVDAKVDYPAACNAVEKVLVHEGLVATGGLAKLQAALQDAGVQVQTDHLWHMWTLHVVSTMTPCLAGLYSIKTYAYGICADC